MLLQQVAWGLVLLPIASGLNLRSRDPESALRADARSFPLGAVPNSSLLAGRADSDNTCDVVTDQPQPDPVPDDTPKTCDTNDCITSGIFLIPTSVPTLLPSSTVRQKRAIISTAPPPSITAVLAARAPGVSEPQPLLDPDRYRKNQVRFINVLQKEADGARRNNANTENGGWVYIVPSETQVENWKATAKIDGKDTQFPIGLTADWNEFANQRATWRVFGLEGCTMMIVVSQHGFWAGHLWESSKPTNINGASAFLRRFGSGNADTTPRSQEEFAACAVDPLNQALSANIKSIVNYISLADVKTDKGDPFHDASDVQIFILTRSVSASDAGVRYADRIGELKNGLVAAIPGFNEDNLKIGTYIGAGDPNSGKSFRGTMTFQYSPYHGKKTGDECTPEAAFRVWVEDKPDMKMEKYWDALPSQRSSNQKRDACSSPTPTGPITQPPSKTPSCEYLPMDPDQGRTVAACVCDSSTLPLLTPKPTGTISLFVNSESCKYTSVPTTATDPVTTETETWTSNCQACTLVGGIAGEETCTTVSNCTPTKAPSPTIAAWVGNLSTIDIGNAEDGNGGKDLAQEMFTKLRAFCDDTSCKPNQVAVMDNVEAVISDGEEPLKPAMYLQEAQYSSPKVLEQMLSVGISSWVVALNNEQLELCKEVEYQADADETGSGCAVVMASGSDPYANRLNIGIQLEATGDGFLCDEAVGALTAAITILAPEMLEADALEGVELEAICGVLNDPQGALTSFVGGRAVPTGA
ncbi:hypothetical protein BJ170DRAFT_715060 [Xylariales sp. AK1849]|nr:hypothetical protein BJ170DRAFT_715060 [Xylariales sp. AK1849]